MPIYTYELCEGNCKVCSGTFELNRPINRPELKECPLCRKPVKKIMGSFNTPKHMKPIGPAEARSAGFKMYKKRDTGVYEQL